MPATSCPLPVTLTPRAGLVFTFPSASARLRSPYHLPLLSSCRRFSFPGCSLRTSPRPEEMDPDGSYAWQAAAAEARKPLRLRVRSAARGLLFWGLAAAALALSVMLAPMGSLFLLGPCAPPTDAEAAGLRAEAALLLLSGAGQALAAQVALLVPWRPLAYLAWVVATPTFNHATAVLLRIVACPGHLHGVVAAYFGLFSGILFVALIASCAVVLFGEKK